MLSVVSPKACRGVEGQAIRSGGPGRGERVHEEHSRAKGVLGCEAEREPNYKEQGYSAGLE